MHLKVVGLENIKDLPKGAIFASNHTSELDPIIVPASLPFLSKFMPMFYVSRPREFYKNSGWRRIFYGGLFFKLWGSHSAISGYKDYGVSLSNHIHIIQRRHSLIIYPEGVTARTGEVMVDQAHGGVAFLAEKTGLPIIPVYIGGHYKITLKDYLLRRRHVSIVFGRPIYAKELFRNQISGSNHYKSVAKMVLERVRAIGKGQKVSPQSGYPMFVSQKNVKVEKI